MAEGGIDLSTSDSTLVKYNNPVLVVKHPEKRPRTATETTTALAEVKPPPQTPSSAPAASVGDSRKESEEVLNSILPPKCWEEDGQMWIQTVSSTPATRQDVINLQEMLDGKLEQSQARETGICPVRRELYMQCFGIYLNSV